MPDTGCRTRNRHAVRNVKNNMPLYEYECTNCKERVEIIQRISDPPYSHCPKCGAEMKKLI